MSDDFDDDSEDDYFPEILEGAEDTGKLPKFVILPGLALSHIQLGEMKVDELVKTYVDLRNQLATERKSYKSREAKIKLQMGVISMQLRAKGDDLGVTSFSSPYGTAFKKTAIKYQVADWEALCKYVQATGNFQVLQKRVSPNAAKEIAEVDGSLPTGISSFEEVSFAVRAPTARGKK